MVAGTDNNNGLYAYKFTPTLPPPLSLQATSTQGVGTSFVGVCWHPSGNYIAATYSSTVAIYTFNAGVLTSKTSHATVASNDARTVQFDFSGIYIAAWPCVGFSSVFMEWSYFKPRGNCSSGYQVNGLSWALNGLSIAIGTGNRYLNVYSFNRNLIIFTLWASYNDGQINTSLCWSPDGRTIAYGGESYDIDLFTINPVAQTLTLIVRYDCQQHSYSLLNGHRMEHIWPLVYCPWSKFLISLAP